MKPKKNPNLEIGRNSGIYFAIGLNVMLLFTYFGLEYKTYDKDIIAQDIILLSDDLEDDIPITNIDAPPPPPPPPAAAAPDVITIVEDTEEIEETVIESSEANQEDEIAEPIEVADVEVVEVEEEVSVPFTVVENVPVFPGCVGKNNAELRDCFAQKMNEHIKKHFKYPESALEMGVHGRVFVLFAIDSNGRVSNIKSRGPAALLEKEAERIIGLLPTMEPGKQRGKPVKVPYSIPINFKIQK
ncbi:energy transducer TonB [Hanstruepera ponticola]|uniref:energy transducer TonB n=1 Tax=Hanstruepera ponticola TaxID=2042995 RepID=UPI0017826B1C|nr:energy transducer TonB [Hanstruepera ponticola]